MEVKGWVDLIVSTADTACLEFETDPAVFMATSAGRGERSGGSRPRHRLLQRQDSEVARIQADMDRTRTMLAAIIEQ